jgi:hypothetical protein
MFHFRVSRGNGRCSHFNYHFTLIDYFCKLPLRKVNNNTILSAYKISVTCHRYGN